MKLFGRDVPDWAVYVGAGLGLTGAFLLYKKSKAGSSSATGAAVSSSPSGAYSSDTSSGQQPGIVPYYLTGNAGQQAGFNGTTSQLPQPTPAGTGGGGNIVGPGGSGAILVGGNNPIINSAPNPIAPPVAPPVAPAPPPPAPVQPAPPPAQQVANLPANLLQQIQANGENIIGNLIDPITGGTWWFGSKGGVFAVNGARYLGSASQPGAYYPGLQIVQAIPLGSGYREVSAKGETYNYTG